MDVTIQQQKHVESYLRSVVTALQAEKLAARTVDQLSTMLREQIYEELSRRAADGACSDAVVAEVLAEMPPPGDFAAEAAGEAGARRQSTRTSTPERWAMLISLLLSLGILLACTEGAAWAVKSVFADRRSDRDERVEETERPADSSDATADTSLMTPQVSEGADDGATDPPSDDKSADATTQAPSPHSESGEYAEDDPGLALAMTAFVLGVLVILVCALALAGVVAAAVFAVGLVLLACGLAALNAIVAFRRRSWWAFLRLCLWEVVIVGGPLCGIVVGGIAGAMIEGISWRLLGYGGFALGAVVGVVGGLVGLKILDWLLRAVIRFKQRRMPALRLAVLGKMETIIDSGKKL
ncbi:MAG: hypothetical protein ACYS8X_10420 [Planctomycetota bacterium]